MDAKRFDRITRTLARRGLLRLLFALAGSGGAALAMPVRARAGKSVACAKLPKDSRCRSHGECCSGQCKRKKRKKGKKKKAGKCRCSPLRVSCATDRDCCPPLAGSVSRPVCGIRSGSLDKVCCMGGGGACSEHADCCGLANCTGGVCDP